MIKDKREINSFSRFKKPEYWPFRTLSGEVVSNYRQYQTYFLETWDYILPTASASTVIGTDTFEGGASASWVDGGTGTYSYVTDPSGGAPHGTVKKVLFTSSQNPIFYAETINGTTGNLQGIYSGELDFYMYSDVSVSSTGLKPKFSLVTRSTSPADTSYRYLQSGSQFRLDRLDSGGNATANLGATTMTHTANTWHHHKINWYSIAHPKFFNLFFTTYELDGVLLKNGNVGFNAARHSKNAWFADIDDLVPGVYPVQSGGYVLAQDAPTCRIIFSFTHGQAGSHFVLLDSVKFTKHTQVSYLVP